MSNHLRYCPKHRKPLPCAHCALAQKSVRVAVIEEPPEPESAVVVSVHIEIKPKKRGRPRTPGKDYENEAERKKAERQEKKRQELIAEATRDQKADDKTGGAEGPGRFLTDAPKGKGELVTGFGGKKPETFEQMAGHSENTGLMGPERQGIDIFLPHSFGTFTEESDITLEEVQRRIDSLLKQDIPNSWRWFLENASVNEIRNFLNTTSFEANTGGSTGRRVNTSAPTFEDVSATRKEMEKHEPIFSGNTGVEAKIATQEQNRIDDRLAQLRNDERYCRWEKTDDHQGFVCVLCDKRLGVPSDRTAVGQHFVQEHTTDARRFFRARRVPFRKGYLGIPERITDTRKSTRKRKQPQ